MENRNGINWIRAILIACITVCLLGCPSGQEDTGQSTLIIAPDFSLKTIDGEDIRLSAFRGEKLVHITFWATWCPACLTEIPKLVKLHQAIGDKPVTVLAINVGVNDSVQKVRKLQERTQMPYRIIFDQSGYVAQQYGVMGIPTHVVVGKDGKILGRFNQLPENPKDYFNQFIPS